MASSRCAQQSCGHEVRVIGPRRLITGSSFRPRRFGPKPTTLPAPETNTITRRDCRHLPLCEAGAMSLTKRQHPFKSHPSKG